MQITREERGSWLRLALNGRFDAQGAGIVSEALEKALNHGWRFLELDMGGVDYLSSAGVRVLLHHYQKIGKLKGALSLACVRDRVARILEMAGLYDLLRPVSPSLSDPDHAPAATLDLSGWRVNDFAVDPSGTLIPKSIGKACTEGVQIARDCPCTVVPFPPSTVAVGIGALGYDDDECRDRFGPFLAAGGIAACKPASPASGFQAADYVAYAEAYIPSLQVASGLVLNGSFSHLISFESAEGGTIGLSDLTECMLRILETKAAGFVAVAEGESHVLLACGILSGGSKPDRNETQSHVHSALFPYHPLRLGFVKLKETLAGLFEHELVDVVHIDLSDPSGRSERSAQDRPVRLLRGIAWFSGVKASV